MLPLAHKAEPDIASDSGGRGELSALKPSKRTEAGEEEVSSSAPPLPVHVPAASVIDGERRLPVDDDDDDDDSRRYS